MIPYMDVMMVAKYKKTFWNLDSTSVGQALNKIASVAKVKMILPM